ncbi:MAG TPA: hypothetical protein VMV74_10220, partial [Bacteroidales bacterium]|nr:hypothetical protein [Bacteroidales bacterium]
NSDKKLVPGMFAAPITLITDETNNAIQVPTETIVPDMNEKKIWLYRKGKAELIPVVAGIRTESMVEIMSGVQAGDTVITSGLMQLRPGMAVRLNITN